MIELSWRYWLAYACWFASIGFALTKNWDATIMALAFTAMFLSLEITNIRHDRR
jgi:hypothetical protein